MAGVVQEIGLGGGELAPLLRSAIRELDERAELRLTLLPRALELPLLLLCLLLLQQRRAAAAVQG